MKTAKTKINTVLCALLAAVPLGCSDTPPAPTGTEPDTREAAGTTDTRPDGNADTGLSTQSDAHSDSVSTDSESTPGAETAGTAGIAGTDTATADNDTQTAGTETETPAQPDTTTSADTASDSPSDPSSDTASDSASDPSSDTATDTQTGGDTAYRGNPILWETDPGFLYAADPSAEVFDGKVYVYCSHDQPDAKNYRSMKDYVVLSSDDLIHWTNHGVVLDPQLDPGFEYFTSNMNAPDAAYKDGWYYLYFPGNIAELGVAKSRTPIGPWEPAVSGPIATIFDPTVFVDDDGQAYLYGNDPNYADIGEEGSHILGVKLKDNMIELDGDWMRLTEEGVNEAVHVFKRNGIYYFMARVGGVTKYWMADTPLPQYATFMGTLAPRAPNAPNHTSAIEFHGEWYLFYHRGDVNSGNRFRRSACFDKMVFNEDGSIQLVTYTLGQTVEQ